MKPYPTMERYPTEDECLSDGFLDEEAAPARNSSRSKVPRLISSDSRFSSEFSEVHDGGLLSDEEESGNEAYREVNAVAKREILGVRLWKALFLLVALATAGLISAGTYILLKSEEDDDYNESYDLFVSAMRDAVSVHVESIHLGFESMAKMISTAALDKGDKFPFFTMGNFEATGETIRKFSNVEIFAWAPYVEAFQVPAWMNYSMINQGWLETSRNYSLRSNESSVVNTDYVQESISPIIYDLNGPGGTPQPAGSGPPYSPIWQTSPPVFNPKTINFDFNAFPFASPGRTVLEKIRQGFFTRVLVPGETGAMASLIFKPEDHQKFHEAFVDWNKTANSAFGNPHGAFMQPVFVDPLDTSSKIAGYVAVALGWDAYMTGLLPEGRNGIHAILKNDCGQTISYRLTGNRAYFEGWGDFHESDYDDTERVIPFHRPLPENYEPPDGQCIFNLHIYSTKEFEDSYRSSLVITLTAVVAGAFLLLISSFFFYDMFVRRRNTKVVHMAAKSNEIVSSLFPRNVRDRLYNKSDPEKGEPQGILKAAANMDLEDISENDELLDGDATETRSMDVRSNTHTIETLDDEGLMYKSSPIADLYPDCTIMFADISGFTAWSSTREPTQVFTLLETLYRAFDTYAKRRRVFKVETIGDCYVAVAGLPEPMSDHAIVMARFAKDCLHKMRELTRRLESILGPDTMDLDLRVGLHSGSVTAGVLRGEKSRFQLFGDTMNTASRMESTGRPGFVQISQSTADLVKAAGKSHWLTPREDKVVAKGKGEMQTYFVSSTRKGDSVHEGSLCDSSAHLSVDGSEFGESGDSGRSQRLVKWNVEVFSKLLARIVGHRSLPEAARVDQETESAESYGPALEELKDSIDFPSPTSGAEGNEEATSIEALEQLEHFIASVAGLYKEHPYHDFAHASHVTLSVVKLLSQMKSDEDGGSEREISLDVNPALLLSLDPIAQFACLLAALCQDLAHEGVPNFVLAAEGSADDAEGGRCIAEQNSIALAWELLMNKNYQDLRAALYQTEQEKQHFRQVFVQCVLATDLFDTDLQKNRELRWEKAFGSVRSLEESVKTRLDRQCTLVLESIVQVSDMIHAVQHFDIYCKWNSLLFEEVYGAYTERRITKDPIEEWYKGELSFFDDVVLPMTQKLQESNAFKDGTIEEYIDFANTNRIQWEQQGQSLVAQMLVNFDTPKEELIL